MSLMLVIIDCVLYYLIDNSTTQVRERGKKVTFLRVGVCTSPFEL